MAPFENSLEQDNSTDGKITWIFAKLNCVLLKFYVSVDRYGLNKFLTQIPFKVLEDSDRTRKELDSWRRSKILVN